MCRLGIPLALLLAVLPAGCGAGDRPVVVAGLGDSITAGSPLWDQESLRAGGPGEGRSREPVRAPGRAAARRVRFRNCGVFGERTDQIAARLDECAKGVPWINGYPLADHRIRRLNRMIHLIGRREHGATVFGWYERLEDPRRPGRMKREWTIDGDHPSVEGYRRLGEAMSPGSAASLFRR